MHIFLIALFNQVLIIYCDTNINKWVLLAFSCILARLILALFFLFFFSPLTTTHKVEVWVFQMDFARVEMKYSVMLHSK